MFTLRRATFALIAAAVALAIAPAAHAHVEPDIESVAAGSEATIAFVAEHGCDESPIVRVDIQLPDGVTDAEPQPKEGWDSRIDGDVAVFEWEGVGGDESGEFGVRFTAPDTPGATLLFPTIQTCAEGSIDWIQEDASGDRPAPRLEVAEADPNATTTTAAESDDEPATTEAPDASDDDATTTTAASDPAEPADEDADDGGSARPFVLAGVVAAIAVAGVFGAAKLRQRQES